MTSAIDFYFDFSSPYGYFGSVQIDELAARHGRSVVWRPYLMGAVMKLTGSTPLVARPMIADYAGHDLARCARLLGVPFRLPHPFPVASIAPCRAYYWLSDQDSETARQFARAIYTTFFDEGRNISEPDTVADVAANLGVDREALLAALQAPEIKARLKAETDAAITRGVFGSPFYIVDGEPFWGHDRLAHVERWIETGGW